MHHAANVRRAIPEPFGMRFITRLLTTDFYNERTTSLWGSDDSEINITACTHDAVLCRVTLTEQRGGVPFSSGSTNWYISFSGISVSRVTLIKNLGAHSGDVIPHHDWMRQGRGRTTVNFYKDGNCVTSLWTTTMESNTTSSMLLPLHVMFGFVQ